jgi:hypothetical protein
MVEVFVVELMGKSGRMYTIYRGQDSDVFKLASDSAREAFKGGDWGGMEISIQELPRNYRRVAYRSW